MFDVRVNDKEGIFSQQGHSTITTNIVAPQSTCTPKTSLYGHVMITQTQRALYFLYFTVLYLLYFTLLYFTFTYFTLLLLYFTLLYFTLLYFTLLYFTLLYFTLLYFTLLYFTLLYFTFVYRLYHLGRRGKKETLVCCTSECLGRRDIIQR